MSLEGFHLPIPLLFILLLLFGSSAPIVQDPSQAFPGVFLVGPASKAILLDVIFILALRNISLLAWNAVMLRTGILWVFLTPNIVGQQDTITLLILARHLCTCIAIRIDRLYLKGRKSFYLSHIQLSIISCLHGGKKVTPLSMDQGERVLMFVFYFILHGCWKSDLSCNVNIIIR